LVGVVLQHRQLLAVVDTSQAWVFANNAEAFGEDDELVARKFVLLDRLANDLLGDAVGVDIGCEERHYGNTKWPFNVAHLYPTS
jgi:hypothetical protein